MGDRTGIAWADATWNPVTGCSHVSAGCEHCYAETLSLRHGWSKKPWTAPNAAENVVLHNNRLWQPLKWTKPRRVFVNSMSDLFHEQVPVDFIADVFAVMSMATAHTFQILTKRPERMRTLLNSDEFPDLVETVLGGYSAEHGWCVGDLEAWPLPNVWLGVSIEQDRWCNRADLLRETPAAVRFLSLEPLLEPLPSLDLTGISWVIFGGESGNGSINRKLVQREWERDADGHGTRQVWVPKPWAIDEAQRLRDLTHAAGASFFLKQWGGATPKSGGDLLDGVRYHEWPEARPFPIDLQPAVGE